MHHGPSHHIAGPGGARFKHPRGLLICYIAALHYVVVGERQQQLAALPDLAHQSVACSVFNFFYQQNVRYTEKYGFGEENKRIRSWLFSEKHLFTLFYNYYVQSQVDHEKTQWCLMTKTRNPATALVNCLC